MSLFCHNESNPLDYAHEFNFTIYDNDHDNFDNVYNQCTVPDPSGTRRQVIFDKIIYVKHLLKSNSNLRFFDSSVTLDGYSYKVVIRIIFLFTNKRVI